MIIHDENTRITAPQTSGDFLSAFQKYKQNKYLLNKDLYLFLTTPSRERDEFLELQKVKYGTDSFFFIESFYS